MIQKPNCLEDNLARVRENVAVACGKSGRDPADVRLVAVTKYTDLETIRALLTCDVLDLGESRVQQLTERIDVLGARPARLDDEAVPHPWSHPRWHMIGHLQRNKVRKLIPAVRILHSLDSARLADEVQRRADESQCHVDCFIEVNVSAEAAKHGVTPAGLPALVAHMAAQSNLQLRGLMTMAPANPNPEAARPHFSCLRKRLDELRDRGLVNCDCNQLSMGMSHDYSVAVEEGATIIRVGSALFDPT
jgi:hypothetical protein